MPRPAAQGVKGQLDRILLPIWQSFMPHLPRLAVGTVQPDADSQAMCWGLMELLVRAGIGVQHFRSRACFAPLDGATAITGNGSRHLDNWLMTPEVCRETFVRGAATSDLALVEGRFAPARRSSEGPGGDLEVLCQWLEIPPLAVIDVSRLGCGHVPQPPGSFEGILLDRVPGDQAWRHWQTMFETIWKVPVVGGLADLPAAREELANLSPGSEPPRALCAALGQSLARTCCVQRLRKMAERREFPITRAHAPWEDCGRAQTHVALAFDAAFHCYFPDTLDVLETLGVSVVDFSPLRDESLPRDCDVVYIGCGHPERFARELAGNHCMALALKSHVCAGRRIYAEGGGLAYLCQHLELPDGERQPMAGVLPAVARRNPQPEAPRAVELTLAVDNWLGTRGAHLRGYLNTCWNIEPNGPLTSHVEGALQRYDLVGRRHALASRVHLNFAAQPRFLRGFLRPLAGNSAASTTPPCGQ